MRDDEEFVARCLIEFLGGPTFGTVEEGADPPDLYIKTCSSRVGVEVTQLWNHTFEPDGTLGNRATQDAFGIKIIQNLDKPVGPLLPNDLSLLVGIQVPVAKPARFRKILTEWVSDIAANPVLGARTERMIEGSKTRASVIPRQSSGKGIVGYVENKNTSADIGLNAQLTLQNAIRIKDNICAPLNKPIWLALLNAYWLADADTYASAYQQIYSGHCFERVFLISGNGTVCELMLA